MEAGRQAARSMYITSSSLTATDVRAGQVEAAGAAGGRAGAAASPSDALTRTHRMTMDEAKMILNLKEDVSLEANKNGISDAVKKEMIEHYERLFEINAPPAPKGKTGGGSGSFYIQSKIVRARERIEAEWKLLTEAAAEHQASS